MFERPQGSGSVFSRERCNNWSDRQKWTNTPRLGSFLWRCWYCKYNKTENWRKIYKNLEFRKTIAYQNRKFGEIAKMVTLLSYWFQCKCLLRKAFSRLSRSPELCCKPSEVPSQGPGQLVPSESTDLNKRYKKRKGTLRSAYTVDRSKRSTRN